MAFYRFLNKSLEISDDSLFGPGFCLLITEYKNYAYPVDGWHWFDTYEEASSFFGIEN